LHQRKPAFAAGFFTSGACSSLEWSQYRGRVNDASCRPYRRKKTGPKAGFNSGKLITSMQQERQQQLPKQPKRQPKQPKRQPKQQQQRRLQRQRPERLRQLQERQEQLPERPQRPVPG
jgi:hypothetical protein